MCWAISSLSAFWSRLACDWIVRRASANAAAFLNVEAEKLLGTPLAVLFSEKALHAIRNRVTLLRGPDSVERLFHLALTEGGPRL